jgi:hypothetical protein
MIPLHYPNRDFPFARTSGHMPTDATLNDQAKYVTGDLQRATPAHKIALLRHLIDPEAAGKHYEKRQTDSVWTGFETQHRLLQVAKHTGADLDAIRRAALAMVRASLPLHLSQQYDALKGEADPLFEAFGNAPAKARKDLQAKLHTIEINAQQAGFLAEQPVDPAVLQSQTQQRDRHDARVPEAIEASSSHAPASAGRPTGEELAASGHERSAAAAPGSGTVAHFPGAARQNHYTLTVRRENMHPFTVAEGMDRYRQNFCHRSDAQIRLYNLFCYDEQHFASDLQAFCAMSAVDTQKMVFDRELETHYGYAHFPSNVNETVLGNARAAMRDLPQARVPGNQLALLMRTPMWTVHGTPRDLEKESAASPLILSVCAPALDDADEPEWEEYVDRQGALKADAYTLAMATISEQIVEAALRYPDHKVVLSAFGMDNYIGHLQGEAKASACDIGVANMRALIARLQELKKPLGYTDRAQDLPFWQQVNQGLTTAIGYEGKVPGTWINDKTMIVNAWDPCSLVGNGCKADDSMDGFVGRNSLVHEAHAHAILSWRNNRLDWQ